VELVGAFSPLAATPSARMIRRLLGLALFAALLAACGEAAPPLAEPPPDRFDVGSLPPIELPRDDAPHANLTEWWYVSGHLQTAEGDPFGFEFALFQSVRAGAPPGYAAHFAVTDIGRQRFRYGERTEVADVFETLPAQPTGLNLSVDGWTLRGVPGGFSISAGLDTVALQVELIPTKPAAVHNESGILDFSPYGWSYYYSYTRAAVRGVLLDNGLPRPVTGTAWIDHQWGDFISVTSGGWDWYSVHLVDGRDFTASVVRDEFGSTVFRYGTLVGPAGETTHLSAADVDIRATGRWTSPHTGVVYPSGWTISVPAEDLRLRLEPVLRDQELDTRASTGVVYWEGAVQVSGDGGVAGLGYVELTGYRPTPSA
jgi:predicted secreted hydrolase